MITNRTKKCRKLRGSKTHGWGAMKKHRGAGSRGGRGMAGTGKRGDAKKPSIWKDRKYFGRHGFKMHGVKIKALPVNIGIIDQNIDKYISQKLIEKSGESYSIDLAKLGFNKLLGSGKTEKKLNIKCRLASKKAVEKIEKAGGSVLFEDKNLIEQQKTKQS